jgi:hypothetical protein
MEKGIISKKSGKKDPSKNIERVKREEREELCLLKFDHNIYFSNLLNSQYYMYCKKHKKICGEFLDLYKLREQKLKEYITTVNHYPINNEKEERIEYTKKQIKFHNRNIDRAKSIYNICWYKYRFTLTYINIIKERLKTKDSANKDKWEEEIKKKLNTLSHDLNLKLTELEDNVDNYGSLIESI